MEAQKYGARDARDRAPSRRAQQRLAARRQQSQGEDTKRWEGRLRGGRGKISTELCGRMGQLDADAC